MVFKNAKNSKQQGDVGLGTAIAYYTQEGYTVCIPLTDGQDYDLIVENGEMQRVQVKTTRQKKSEGVYEVNLRVFGGNRSGKDIVKKFDNEKVELLFVLCENGDRYNIPAGVIKSGNCIVVGRKYKEYKI